VRRGEIRGLIGPNGPGKTTLLNVICGTHRPQQGDVRVNGVSRFNCRRRRSEEIEMEAAARSALTFVGMSEAAERPATALSFGQQRVVEIARTLISEPTLVLLDEPAAGLSADRLVEFGVLLRRIRDQEG
jgi:branched-chain amino acid transport system ATP-binding protein